MSIDITLEAVLGLCTTIITYIFGELSKKYDWVESKYIPIQNLIIGVVGGILAWLLGLGDNIIVSIVSCLIGSFTAGGLYDTIKTGKEDEKWDYL